MEINKPYWHELTEGEIQKLLSSHITWAEIQERYIEPSWCGYYQALRGKMGCWSLTNFETRNLISIDYCKGCDCFLDATQHTDLASREHE